MSELPVWQPSDIDAIRGVCPQPDATSDDIRELLNTYYKRGLTNPVGFAIKNASQAGRALAEITARRRKAETAKILEELRTGVPCEHGVPDGNLPHPETGLPASCALCRAQAQAARATDGPGDSGDTQVSPDDMAAGQEERIDGDTGDNQLSPWLHWSAAELLGKSFPPARFAVDGLIPEGVTVLAGAPKVGKSWLALNIGVDVSTGGKAFGAISTVQGDVLYLSLEDTPRRLQRRLRKVLGDNPAPDRLTLSVQCPPMPAGAIAIIRGWLTSHPSARMVIIDVFERIRGPVLQHETHYSADYRVVSMVKKLADDYSIAIILIHHIRKMSSDDYLNEISGTTGLSGAADTIIVLKRARGEHDGTLSITGRDVEESEHALKFHGDRGTWELLGPAADYTSAETRRQIMNCLRAGHDGAKPADVARATGLSHDLVKKTMQRMAGDSQLEKGTAGRYYIPKTVPAVPGK
jgi:hypothetical protein